MKPIYDTPLPKGWRESELRSVTVRKRGYSWSKDQETSQPGDGTIPVIRIPNVNSRLTLDDLLYLRDVPEDARKESGVTKDWILFVASNGNPARIGDSVLMTEDREMVFASFLQAIASKDSEMLIPEFLASWLRIHNVHESFSRTSQQTTGLANFSWSAVKKLPVRFPDNVQEQRQIMAVFGATDEAIKAVQDQLAATRRLKRAMLQQLFTTGLPVKDHSLYVSKWITAPQAWQQKPLRDLADVEAGFTMGRDLSRQDTVTVPYVTVVNIQDGFCDLKNIGSIEIKRSELETGSLAVDDILMTEGGDRDKLGRGCIWSGEVEPCAYQNHIFRVRFRDDEYRPKLFHYLIQTWQAKRYFYSHAKQTNNLCTINSRELKKFIVAVPEPDEQEEMITLLENADSAITVVESKVERLQRLKKSLLQNLLTGKVCVAAGVTA